MAKGLFYVALTACLLASAQSLNPLDLLHPVTNIVVTVTNVTGGLEGTLKNLTGSLTNTLVTVTNVTGGLVGTLTNATGGLTKALDDLLKPLINNLIATVNNILNGVVSGINIGNLTDTVGTVLQTAVSQPLVVVTQLTGSVTGILNPANLTSDVKGVLKPVLDIVANLTNQLSGTGAVGCILNSASTGLKTIVFTVTNEIITCGIPKTNDLFKITANITSVAGNFVNTTINLVGNTTKCLQQSATYANIGATVGCVVDPVKNSVSVATNTLSSATPIVSDALGSVIQIAGCAGNAVKKAVNETAVLVNSILQCALEKGVSPTLPNLPGILPNFTAIANKAVYAIEAIVSSALGPKSPIKNLFATLDQVKNIANTVTPNALKTVDTSIQSIQEIINLALTLAGGNLQALACVADAQKVLTDLAPVAIGGVVNCTVNITNDVVPLAAQAAALDIGLKTGLLNAGANAVTKCVGFILSVDAEKCFDTAISEVEKYVQKQFVEINNVIDSAQSLIDTVQNCLNSVLSNNNAVGQTIVAKQKECLARQGIVIKTDNITFVLISGKATIEKAVSGFSGSINIVASTSVNIQSSVDFIKSINKTAVENVIKGQISSSQTAVLQIEAALKNNTNPAVKACIDATKDRLSKLETSAVASILNCVSPIKDKITLLADQAVANDLALKQKLANASGKAVEQCSASVSNAIAQKCFLDIETNLNVYVTQTVQRVQQISNNAELLVVESTKCVSGGSASAGTSVDDELAAFTSCLAAQGIKVKVERS